jgi:hypothetical protein
MGLGTATFNASRAIVIINGSTFGTVQSADWTITYGVKPTHEIDRVVPREISPTTYSIKFKLAGVKVMAQNFDESGVTSAPGTNYIQPYITLAILDRLTNIPLVYIEAGMIEELNYNISSKSIMNFDMSGIGFAGLNDQSLIDSENNPPKPISL